MLLGYRCVYGENNVAKHSKYTVEVCLDCNNGEIYRTAGTRIIWSNSDISLARIIQGFATTDLKTFGGVGNRYAQGIIFGSVPVDTHTQVKPQGVLGRAWVFFFPLVPSYYLSHMKSVWIKTLTNKVKEIGIKLIANVSEARTSLRPLGWVWISGWRQHDRNRVVHGWVDGLFPNLIPVINVIQLVGYAKSHHVTSWSNPSLILPCWLI